MTVTTFVRADRLFLASKFQSTEETRYCLNGVFIESVEGMGAKLVSTDGYRMAIFLDRDGFTNKPLILALPKLAHRAYASIKKAHREKSWFGILDSGVNETTGKVIACLWSTHEDGVLDESAFLFMQEDMHNPKSFNVVWSGSVDLIDGDFVDYRKLVPKDRPRSTEPSGYNVKYLRSFEEVSASSNVSLGIKVIGDNSVGAAMVDAGRDDFLGLIMPISFTLRAVEERDGVFASPDWATAGLPPPLRSKQGDGNEFKPDTV